MYANRIVARLRPTRNVGRRVKPLILLEEVRTHPKASRAVSTRVRTLVRTLLVRLAVFGRASTKDRAVRPQQLCSQNGCGPGDLR